MKHFGRTFPFIVAALLTLQGLTAMAVSPAKTLTDGGQVVAAPDRQALVREILGLWADAPNPVVGENRGQYGDLRAALKLATVEQLLEARQGRTLGDVWAALPKGATSETKVIPLAQGQRNPQVIGDAGDDLEFTPVTPCRIIDTRSGVAPWTGQIGPNSGRQFYAALSDYSPQGGFAGSCGIPTSPYPTGIVINVTSTGQTGQGNLRVIETFGGTPTASLVNYVAGVNIANATAARMAHFAGVGDIFIYSGGNMSHVVVDIMGYFSPAAATPLDTIQVSNSISCTTGTNCSASVACTAGYSVTGGGFQGCCFQAGFNLNRSFASGNGWWVDVNNTAGTQNLVVYAICSRVPGH